MASGGTGKNELSTNDTMPNSQVAYGLPAPATHQSYSLLSMAQFASTKALDDDLQMVMAGHNASIRASTRLRRASDARERAYVYVLPSPSLVTCDSHIRQSHTTVTCGPKTW